MVLWPRYFFTSSSYQSSEKDRKGKKEGKEESLQVCCFLFDEKTPAGGWSASPDPWNNDSQQHSLQNFVVNVLFVTLFPVRTNESTCIIF